LVRVWGSGVCFSDFFFFFSLPIEIEIQTYGTVFGLAQTLPG